MLCKLVWWPSNVIVSLMSKITLWAQCSAKLIHAQNFAVHSVSYFSGWQRDIMWVMSSFFLHKCLKLLYSILTSGWESWAMDIFITVILVRLKGGQEYCKEKRQLLWCYQTEKERSLGDPIKQLVRVCVCVCQIAKDESSCGFVWSEYILLLTKL